MSEKDFKALIVEEDSEGNFSRKIATKATSELPENEALIRVSYSALNYKDALSASGNKGVTRKYPHTPGIDAAGVVEEDKSGRFKKGEEVIVTSYDLGMNTSGGFSEYISVPSSWIVPLPDGLTLKESMIQGTAGFTAGLALYKMEMCGQNPMMGPILVTGASGGVGSMAIAILAKAGYEVIASTGKKEAWDYLKKLGATECISREDVDDQSGKPLLKPKWAGAIDTVGGNTLATAIKACDRNGSVAVCGLVGSPKLGTTVFPFILNGANLLGIESAECPMEIRLKIWHKLASSWYVDSMDEMATYCSLDELNGYIDQILKGQTKGRVVVDLT
ncbi:MAG: YhdH/YhfP family quinone oxidoreductase [Bacteroidota bacterium]